MKRRKRKTKRTIGVSLFVLLASCLAPLMWAGEKPPADPAVVAGTVFRDPGFAVGDAEVVLKVKTQPQGAKTPKTQKVRSNNRGEFSFTVPPVAAGYVVSARAEGLVPEEKPAVISGGPERLEINFTLKPESPKGK